MLGNIGFLINRNNLNLFPEIIKKYHKIYVEIGSGNGDYIVNIADREKDSLFIAVEIKFKRIFKTLKKLINKNVKNLLVVHGDGSVFVDFFLENNSVDNFIINFPDPWYKKRHQKRRLVNKNFYQTLYQKLKKDGNIYIATDYSEYADVIIDNARKSNIFKNIAFSEKWLYKDIYTKYEKTYIAEGKKIYYLTLSKTNQ